ncbi:MAG: hypothetical protein LBL27_03355, partial [Coriobacteriales bacterium]|jgi:hypothetical protein|nr:hypothetical protein [Coriobacteriales bacterium]
MVAWIVAIPSITAPLFTSPGDAVIDSSSSAPDVANPAPDTAEIPILFDLPADYRVAATDYDNGMSVYALESTTRGDVVLAMYRENEQQADAASGAASDAASGAASEDVAEDVADAASEGETTLAAMDEVLIDGTAVAAKVNEAYMLLTFEREGVWYTLSSRDDMGALAAFYRSIVRAAL